MKKQNYMRHIGNLSSIATQVSFLKEQASILDPNSIFTSCDVTLSAIEKKIQDLQCLPVSEVHKQEILELQRALVRVLHDLKGSGKPFKECKSQAEKLETRLEDEAQKEGVHNTECMRIAELQNELKEVRVLTIRFEEEQAARENHIHACQMRVQELDLPQQLQISMKQAERLAKKIERLQMQQAQPGKLQEHHSGAILMFSQSVNVLRAQTEKLLSSVPQPETPEKSERSERTFSLE